MSILSYVKDVRERLTPVRVSSAFLEKGVLTPEEFVQAGDQLVFKCPTWSWESGSSSLNKSYLPKDKQYLVTKGVHCMKRVSALQNSLTEREVDDEDEAKKGGISNWIETSFTEPETQYIPEDMCSTNDDFDLTMEREASQKSSVISGLSAIELNDRHFNPNLKAADDSVMATVSESSYPDLATFNEDNVIESDPSTLQPYFTAVEPEDNILKTRTYDISITYDKYYQVPRLWLIGYDQSGSSLTSADIFEDIMQDYANQTVTMEAHPHIGHGTQAASIHPCRHAHVMKNIIETLVESGAPPPRVDQYLFLFLKFIQSVIPTVDYDFTMEVDAAL